jgi:hypothetical protein
MFAQSMLGLLFHAWYRDVRWIKTAWVGNDMTTLFVALPLLLLGLRLAARGAVQGFLLWIGGLGYAVYNYCYYLFGAALNAFFPFYLAALIASGIALILALSDVAPSEISVRVRGDAPVRVIGGYFAVLGGALVSIWLTMWAGYVFAGRPLPVDPEAFKLVAALDSVLMAPVLVISGALLWRRKGWGWVMAAIAGVQGSLYLLVLSINSAIAVALGIADAPGEIPIWGTLALLTSAMTFLLFAGVRGSPGAASSSAPEPL